MHTLTEKVNFIRRVFGQYELARNEKNIAVKCPFCSKITSDKKKLVIRLSDDACHCWVCGYKSRSLVKVLKKKSPNDVREYVDKFYPELRTKYQKQDVAPQQEVVQLPKDFVLLQLASMSNPDYRAVKKYVEDRNISDRDMWFYKLGVSNEPRWQRRVIIPSFDDIGLLNDYVGRAINPNVYNKYDSPTDDKLSHIFNEMYIDWKKQLVLCEGPFDMMKCGENTVPLLGSELNEESLLFERIIVNNTPIALALDSDMLETKVPKMSRVLQEYDIDVKVVRVPDDPGALTKEEFQECLMNATPLTWESNLKSRLKKMASLRLTL